MKIHTEEKPYLCKHCDESFLQNSNFNLHILWKIFLIEISSRDTLKDTHWGEAIHVQLL